MKNRFTYLAWFTQRPFRARVLAGGILAMLLAANALSATPLVITTKTLPNAVAGTPYSQTLSASGGSPPYSWVLQSGGLPSTLTLNAMTGQISGTPTASGSWAYAYPYSAYIRVTDSASSTAYEDYSMSFLPPASTASNTNYSLTVVNGSGSGSYAANTSVPISANPAPAGQAFKNWSGATVANALSSSTTLVMPAAPTTVTANYAPVTQPLALTGKTLPNAVVGTAYSQTLVATGGQPPYSWALQSGGLPSLLTLNPTNGQITGMPTASGSIWLTSWSRIQPPIRLRLPLAFSSSLRRIPTIRSESSTVPAADFT
jgi:hypothetical protein